MSLIIGSIGDDQSNVTVERSIFSFVRLPLLDHFHGKSIGPLAIVEDDRRGTRPASELLQKRKCSPNGAPFTKRLRTEPAVCDPPQLLRLRKQGRKCLRAISEVPSQLFKKLRILVGLLNDLKNDLIENMKRTGRVFCPRLTQ